MTAAALSSLLANGTIERVEPDRRTADKELGAARAHIGSAALLAERDPASAFAVGYDAIRKAISAHMGAAGYRARKGGGHHERVARYARAALVDADIGEDLLAIDQLRLLRNQSQYEGLQVEPAEVEEQLVHARAIVGAIGDDLGL